MRLELVQHVAAPRDVVWDVLVDWERQPAWMVDARAVHVLGTQREGVGVVLRCPTRVLGWTVQDLLRVTAWEPRRRLEIVHLGRIITGSGGFELEDRPDDDDGAVGPAPGRGVAGTVVRWWEEVDPPLGALGELVASRGLLPVLRRIFGRSLRNLAAVAEREHLRRRDDELRRRDAALAAVAHDLRAPLTVIGGFTEALRRTRPDDAEAQRLLDPIERNVRRLGALADDLLAAAGLDAGTLVAAPRTLELGPLLYAAPRELAGYDDTVEVRVEVPDGCVAWVDPGHLDRMLASLLVNARLHGRPPVEVTARRLGTDHVEIAVRDHGDGVAPADLDGLFARFQRGSGSAATPGMGLGLAIVRELATLAGGDVRHEDAAPGARLLLRLPVAPPPTAPPTTEAPAGEAPAGDAPVTDVPASDDAVAGVEAGGEG